MKDILNISTVKLKKIIALKGQIERLQAQLQAIVGGPSPVAATVGSPIRKRRAMSAEARRKISLAQKARWAKQKGK